MGEQVRPDPVDAAISVIAGRQHGVIGYPQLKALGLSRQSIDHRVRNGRLHRIHRGVYAVGHKRLTPHGRWMAAVLAGGDRGVLSHRSAAALWQLLPARGHTHVTTPRDLHNRDGIQFHSQSLQPDEVTIHDGIPVTTVARTLLDIAATEPAQLERAFNEAEYRRLWDATGVAALLERYPRRPGAKALARLADAPLKGITREELEHTFHALVERHDLPKPLRNQPLTIGDRTYHPDAMWPEARLIVELDGRGAHDTTSRFDDDRERDRILTRAGWIVIRLTWKHVTTDADQVATDLRALTA
jgi:very-short-patch-repair endonuclease/predicted transcriptional regulator of viral defense system